MAERIFVVEDNADLLGLLALILDFEGYEVRKASNGQDACECLIREKVLPDLIVLDLQMPIMDGWKFVQVLKGIGLPGAADIPLMVITASTHDPEWAAATVHKPFEVDEFLSTVRMLLERSPAG